MIVALSRAGRERDMDGFATIWRETHSDVLTAGGLEVKVRKRDFWVFVLNSWVEATAIYQGDETGCGEIENMAAKCFLPAITRWLPCPLLLSLLTALTHRVEQKWL